MYTIQNVRIFRFSFVLNADYYWVSLFSSRWCNGMQFKACDWLHRQLISSENRKKKKKRIISRCNIRNDDVKLTCKYESENAKIPIVTARATQLLEMNYACALVCVRVLVSYWIRKVLRVRNEFGLAGVQCLTRFIEINKWYCYVFVVKEWRKFGEREKNHRITLCSSIYSGFRHDNREIISHDGKNNNNRITIRIKIKIHKFPRVAWMNR